MKTGPPDSAPRPGSKGTNVFGYTYIYEHADFWGHWLGIYCGQGAYNLTEWEMGCTLWFCNGSHG